MPGNVHEATLSSRRALADGVIEYRFDAGAPVQSRAGQFISLEVGRDADDNPILRSYSLASDSNAPELMLIVKQLDGGRATEWFKTRQIGDRVRFTGPMGFFVLDFTHPGDVVFGATGVGIAPVLPMARELLARPETGRVILHWGNRHARYLFWHDEFAALQKNSRFALRRWLTQPPDDWREGAGRIVQPIRDALPELAKPTFYLVGNGAMIRDVKHALVERGVDRKRQIRNEAFFD